MSMLSPDEYVKTRVSVGVEVAPIVANDGGSRGVVDRAKWSRTSHCERITSLRYGDASYFPAVGKCPGSSIVEIMVRYKPRQAG